MARALSGRSLRAADERYAKRQARARVTKEVKDSFFEKTFATLTSKEKDDLLKALAIRAGIISE